MTLHHLSMGNTILDLLKNMNKTYTEAQLLKDNWVVGRNEALEVKPILLGRLFFLYT